VYISTADLALKAFWKTVWCVSHWTTWLWSWWGSKISRGWFVATQILDQLRNRLKRTHITRIVPQRRMNRCRPKRHQQGLRKKTSTTWATVKRQLPLGVNSTFSPTMVIGQIYRTGISRGRVEISRFRGKTITPILAQVAVAYTAMVCQEQGLKTMIIWLNPGKNRLTHHSLVSLTSNKRRASRSDNSNNSRPPRFHMDRVTLLPSLDHQQTKCNEKIASLQATLRTLVSKQSLQWPRTLRYRNRWRPISTKITRHPLTKESVR